MQGTYKQVHGGVFGYEHAFKPVNSKDRDIQAEALAWCYERFGPQSGEEGWTVGWGEAYGQILFDDPKDAMLFKLTWT